MKVNDKTYIFLVYCNKDPIVYGVYRDYRKAVKYANDLIVYRRPLGFYHFYNTSRKEVLDILRSEDNLLIESRSLFYSACIKDVKAGLRYDKCYVQIECKKLS